MVKPDRHLRPQTILALSLAIGVAVTSSGCGSAAAPSEPVTDTAGLIAVLKAARPGDTIKLAPGQYDGVVITKTNFEGPPVTITSADTARRATLVGLTVADSSGLTFRELDLTQVGSKDPYYSFRIQDCHDLKFTRLSLHGDRNAEPATQLAGLLLTRSTNVSITHSEFDHQRAAIIADIDNGIDISYNVFANMSKGGVEMGGSSNVRISDNYFTDFQVGRGVHSDAMQVYTANAKVLAHNISILNNLYDRGGGDAAQGIFVQDEDGSLPFSDVTIADNAIIGGMWDSIYLKHANGDVQVTNNIAATWAGADMARPGTPPPITDFKAFIFMRGDLSGAKVTMKGNRAQVYMGSTGQQVAVPAGNATLGEITDKGQRLLQDWARVHPSNPRFARDWPNADTIAP